MHGAIASREKLQIPGNNRSCISLRTDGLSHCRSNKFQGRRAVKSLGGCVSVWTDRYDPRIDPYGTSSNLVNGLITAKLFPRDYPLRADFSTEAKDRERERGQEGAKNGRRMVYLRPFVNDPDITTWIRQGVSFSHCVVNGRGSGADLLSGHGSLLTIRYRLSVSFEGEEGR